MGTSSTLKIYIYSNTKNYLEVLKATIMESLLSITFGRCKSCWHVKEWENNLPWWSYSEVWGSLPEECEIVGKSIPIARK